MKIGHKCRASVIPQERNMQILTDEDDVRWALEQHAQDAQDLGFTPENCDGIIIAGNEDSPIYVWGTRKVDREDGVEANNIEAVYTLLTFEGCDETPYYVTRAAKAVAV
jgi:hypothetical protein